MFFEFLEILFLISETRHFARPEGFAWIWCIYNQELVLNLAAAKYLEASQNLTKRTVDKGLRLRINLVLYKFVL